MGSCAYASVSASCPMFMRRELPGLTIRAASREPDDPHHNGSGWSSGIEQEKSARFLSLAGDLVDVARL